jgi:hypothetical protein
MRSHPGERSPRHPGHDDRRPDVRCRMYRWRQQRWQQRPGQNRHASDDRRDRHDIEQPERDGLGRRFAKTACAILNSPLTGKVTDALLTFATHGRYEGGLASTLVVTYVQKNCRQLLGPAIKAVQAFMNPPPSTIRLADVNTFKSFAGPSLAATVLAFQLQLNGFPRVTAAQLEALVPNLCDDVIGSRHSTPSADVRAVLPGADLRQLDQVNGLYSMVLQRCSLNNYQADGLLWNLTSYLISNIILSVDVQHPRRVRPHVDPRGPLVNHAELVGLRSQRRPVIRSLGPHERIVDCHTPIHHPDGVDGHSRLRRQRVPVRAPCARHARQPKRVGLHVALPDLSLDELVEIAPARFSPIIATRGSGRSGRSAGALGFCQGRIERRSREAPFGSGDRRSCPGPELHRRCWPPPVPPNVIPCS